MKYKLGDIVEFNPKETIKKGTLAKKVPMEKLQPFCRDISNYDLCKFNGGTKFKNGDTIMARITPCLENGKIAQVNFLDNNEVGFGSTEYIVLRANPNILDKNYLYYLTISPTIRKPAIKSMVGSSGRQRVQTDVVENINIDLPPLKTQQKIASILKSLDDKIELNNKINNNLEEQAKAIFKSWFVDFEPFGGVMPSDWKIGKLSDIADITMGQSPKGDSYNEKKIGTIFFQGRGEFGTRFPTIRLYTTEPKRMAKENDVLMSVRAPVGDINIANCNCCIGRGLATMHSKDNHQSFVLYTMLSKRKELNVFNGQGTVFGSINKESLYNLQVNIPTKKIIDEFENIVASLDKMIKLNYNEICRLQIIRDTLLPKLMSGEINVSNINL